MKTNEIVTNECFVDNINNFQTNCMNEQIELSIEEEENTEVYKVLNALTTEKTKTLCNYIDQWAKFLIQQESDENIQHCDSGISKYSIIPLERIIDLFNIPKLHETYRQVKPESLYVLLVESDLVIDYTYQVLGVLIEKSETELRKRNVGKLKNLLRSVGLKLSYKNSLVSFKVRDEVPDMKWY